jgi:hypothetical protein
LKGFTVNTTIMVLHETIPKDDHELEAMVPGGDEALYRACTAHLTGDASLLSPSTADFTGICCSLLNALHDL